MTSWTWLRRQRQLATHLTNRELLDTLVQASSAPSGTDESLEELEIEAHLHHCDVCRSRSESLSVFLSELAAAGEANFAEAYPPDRIAAQRERIVRRLRRSVEKAARARVLHFPALARPPLSQMHRARRWLGATAIAGLVAGLSIGQFMHFHPERSPELVRAPQNDPQASQQAATTLRRPSPTPPGESSADTHDLFLDELELVLSGPQVPQLSSLDELTPRIRDVAVNVW